MARNFEIDFSTGAINKVTQYASQFREYAVAINVSPLGVAGSIMREMTAAEKIYTFPYTKSNFIWHLADDVRAYYIVRNTHAAIESDYIANKITDSWWRGFGYYPASNDVGPGRIKIATAIDLLIDYKTRFGGGDPLNIQKYYQRYDLLVQDLLSDFSVTIKFAALVAREAEEFFKTQGVHEDDSSSATQWNEYSKEQQAALVVKYYSGGRNSVEKGSMGFQHYNMSGDGSDMFLYNKNAEVAATALGDRLGLLTLSIERPSRDGGPQYFLIDFEGGQSNSDVENRFLLESHIVNGKAVWAISQPNVGPIRIDVAKGVALSSAQDFLRVDKDMVWPYLSTQFDGRNGKREINRIYRWVCPSATLPAASVGGRRWSWREGGRGVRGLGRGLCWMMT